MNSKYIDKISSQIRAYSEERVIDSERRLDDGMRRITLLVQKIYKNPDDGLNIIKEIDQSTSDGFFPWKLVNELRQDPAAFGALNGYFFMPERRAQALEASRILAEELVERADERVIMVRYQDLHTRVLQADRLPGEDREEAYQAILNERDYCDATRDARRSLMIHGRDDQQTPGGSSPGEGAKQAAAPDREWWRNQGKSAEERDVSPQQAQHEPPPLQGRPPRLSDMEREKLTLPALRPRAVEATEPSRRNWWKRSETRPEHEEAEKARSEDRDRER